MTSTRMPSSRVGPIAIVGMAGRFPGAGSVSELWQNLVAGTESITTLDDATLRANEVDYEGLRKRSDYVPRAGIVEGAERWDAPFFKTTPRQAALMDPQLRVWLECAWEALEDGGVDPERFPGSIGVFTGTGTRGNYLMANIIPDRPYLETFIRNRDVDAYDIQIINDRDYIATRAAYAFGLRGPAVTVQCACSTSLVAISMACQSLWSGESDAVLAGGSSIQFPQARGYIYQPGGMLSTDGSSRTFDAAASGTIFSCGVGAVVLQRLEDAIADRRPVYAVIRGAAVNNDGGASASYVAPNEEGQARVIEAAHRIGGIDARSVSYVECHGTATRMGDPLEIRALTRAFRAHTRDNGFCSVGSLKTNLGHMSTAAGVGGVIKAALALHHRILPASLHYTSPNPEIDFPSTPFSVVDSTRAWENNGPLRAGVSAFGVGGTNSHVVLEEAGA
jgi:acyl transferase domain-containing protein